MASVAIHGVRKAFGSIHVIHDVNVEIADGEFVVLVGPSGCGKSTLLAIIGLLDSPTGGIYTLNGKPVSGLSLNERTRIRNREIGFIFQAFRMATL